MTSFDVVVVGSGPGGAAAARELARAGGPRVLVLERGRADPPTGQARQALRELFLPGRSLFRSRLGGRAARRHRRWELAALLRHRMGAPARRPARAWPRPARRHRRPAHQSCDRAPLPLDLLGPRARRVLDSARDLGFDWQPLPKFVDQAVLRRDGWAAARWTARRFVDDAVAAGARLVTGAAVTRVETRAGAVCGVQARVGRQTVRIATATVVLAAGGLGTPMILRSSGIARARRTVLLRPGARRERHGRRARRGLRAADARRSRPARRRLPAHRPVPPALAAQHRHGARRVPTGCAPTGRRCR